MIGTIVSHYEIVDSLGAGGMGEVYKALDRRLQRTVALKFLSPERTGDERYRKRLIREARAVSKLDHPNLCTVFEIDRTPDDRLFIAMAYYDGHTLARALDHGPLPAERATAIAIEALTGLHHAHQRAIYHRDVKPANIMLIADDQVKVLDFGVARQRGQSRLTEEGIAIGTPAYMAPEQIYGRDVDQRADLWAVGVVLYEMLTGRLPFEGESHRTVLYAAAKEAHPALAEPTGAQALRRVVDRALQKDPADRYRDAKEMIADLEAARHDVAPGAPTEVSIVAAGDRPSVVVLPFEDLSPHGDQEYFCAGIAEELNEALGKIAGLRVASRKAAARLAQDGADLRTIGVRLDATSALTGSVRKAGERVRITAQLTDAGSGRQLWSERYDRELHDVFAIQEEIAAAIVERLEGSLDPAGESPGGARRTDDAEAYVAYLKGRHLWNQRTEEALERGVDYFRRAIEIDPGYARAWAGIADSKLILGVYGSAAPRQVMPEARAAALEAIALDPSLAEAHTSLASVRALFDWEWRAAEAGFARAAELDPSYATARQWLAMNVLVPQGRFDEADHQLREALALEPLSAVVTTSLGLLDYYRRDYEAAAERQRTSLELAPGFAMGHLFLGQALSELGDHPTALAEIGRALELAGDSPELLAGLGEARARAGDVDGATEQLQKLLARRLTSYVSSTLVARVFNAMGATEDALDSLARAQRDRAADLVWIGVRPVFDGLRREERFGDLLRVVGLSGRGE